ncbi:MAG: peptidylprolyl isomerase [Candidatus Omnitrophica bacterium]|nr:peptidylprolyl isomerase [Candidatus Omnitrophota bacterium]
MRKKTVLFLIIFTVARQFILTGALAAVVDKIVVVVNDLVITQREVAQHLYPYYEQYSKEYTGRRLESKMLEAEDEIMEDLIDDKLILSDAKRQGIEVNFRQIEERIEQVQKNFATEEEFREALARQNISLSELRQKIKNDIMKQASIREALGYNVSITPIDVRAYYDKNIADFTKPARSRVINTLIKKEKAGRPKEEARFLIERIKELLMDGQDFEELVKEYSEGPHAAEGGQLGLVERGQMREELDTAIFALGEGDVSDIVESPLGYHIFKVTEVIPEETIDFESVKDEVEELIYRERVDKQMKKWLKELRKNAYISVK